MGGAKIFFPDILALKAMPLTFPMYSFLNQSLEKCSKTMSDDVSSIKDQKGQCVHALYNNDLKF